MKKYNIVYADPPWSYDNKSMKYSADDDTNIAADQQYNLMTLEDLKAMPIKDITEKMRFYLCGALIHLCQKRLNL